MATYEETGRYIGGLQSMESKLNSSSIILKWMAHYAYQQDSELMGDIIFDMGTVSVMSDNGVICPCLIDVEDAPILNYSGNVINGKVELVQ